MPPRNRVVQAAARELALRVERERKFDPDVLLFEQQRNFVLDTSPLVLAHCSRRAGKTHGTAFKMLKAARQYDRCLIPYITKSREDGKQNIWPALQDLDVAAELGLKFNENTGDVKLPNGSRLIMRGAGSRREVDKLRGKKYPLAIVDEAQGFTKPELQYLLEDVLDPCLMDYGREAQIAIIGTPNAACAGHFYDLIHDKTGSVHHWTSVDNPHLPDPQGWLDRKRKQMGWDINHPTFLREYCGVWIRDDSGLVYRIKDSLNVVYSRPEADDWVYVLGLDLGYNDPTAFVVLAYSRDLGKTYVIESYEESELIPSAVAAHCEVLDEKYHFAKIIADTGGYGKGIAEELKQKFNLPVQAAQKSEKAAFIEMLNGDLSSGVMNILGHSNQKLIAQAKLLQWDEKKRADGKLVFDNKFSDHLADAWLYGWRECFPHGEDWEPNPPVHGSAEWYQALENKMEQQLIDQIESRHEESQWFDEY